MAFDVQKVIAAYQAGQQLKNQREQKERDAEDRKFEIEKRTHELKGLKLTEKQMARQEAMQQAQIMEGQPAQEMETPFGALPGMTRAEEIPLPPVNIPGVMGPDVSVQPQSMQELLRQQRGQKQFESDLKRQENQVTIPAIPSLGMNEPTTTDSRVAPTIISQAGQGSRQEDQQTFTAGENQKDRTAAMERANKAADARMKAAQAAGLSGQLNPKQVSLSLQMGNALKSHPAYVDMLDIATGIEGITVGLEQKNGLGDISAINSFQRMVDPGATVREGDVALIRAASALMQRILSEYPIEKLQTGAQLPQQTREQMMKAATELYERRAKNYNDTIGSQYRTLAEGAGIPFEYIGSDFATKSNAAPQSYPEGTVISDGKTMKVMRGGKWVNP